MEDLEVIIQRMVEAGESEENIALVIKNYNADKADQVEAAPEVPKEVVAEASGDSTSPSAGTDSSLDSSVDEGLKAKDEAARRIQKRYEEAGVTEYEINEEDINREVEATNKVKHITASNKPAKKLEHWSKAHSGFIKEINNPELYKRKKELEAEIASRPIMANNTDIQSKLDEVNATIERIDAPKQSESRKADIAIKGLEEKQFELEQEAMEAAKSSDLSYEEILTGEGNYQDILKQKSKLKDSKTLENAVLDKIKEDTNSSFGTKDLFTNAARYFGYSDKSEQTIKLSEEVSEEILLSLTENQKEKMARGFTSLDEKEAIIGQAKGKVINRTTEKFKQRERDIISSDLEDTEKVNKIKENTEEYNGFLGQIGYDVAGDILNNQFKKTDARDNFNESVVKKGFLGDVATPFLTFFDEGAKLALKGTAGWGSAFASVGDIFMSDDHYSSYDAFGDVVGQFTDQAFLPNTKDERFSLRKEDGSLRVTPLSVLNTVSRSAGFTVGIALMARRGGAGNIERQLGQFINPTKSVKFTNDLKLMESAYGLTLSDNYREAKRLGLDGLSAAAYTNTLSMIEGITEPIMRDTKFFETTGGTAILKQFQGDLKSATNRKLITESVKRMSKNVKNEFIEEDIVLAVQDLTKFMLVAEHENSEFWDIRNQLELGIVTTGMSGIMGTISMRNNIKADDINIYKAISKDINGVVDNLLKAKEGALTPEAAEGFTKTIEWANNMNKAIKLAPANVTGEQIDLLMEKANLVTEMKSLDPAFHAQYKEKIDAIDAKINPLNKKTEEGVAKAEADIAKRKEEAAKKAGKEPTAKPEVKKDTKPTKTVEQIEVDRTAELEAQKDKLDETYGVDSKQTVGEQINAKYDKLVADRKREDLVPYKAEEVSETTDAKQFSEAQGTAMANRKANKKGDDLQVEIMTEKMAQEIIDDGGKLFMTSDGKSGAYVTNTGYMGGLFKDPNVNRSKAAKVLQEARIKAGGNHFDAFGINTESGKGTDLEQTYIDLGFRPIARFDFDENLAPKGWEKTKLKEKPDNVIFVYDPNYKAKVGEGKRMSPDAWYEALSNAESFKKGSQTSVDNITKGAAKDIDADLDAFMGTPEVESAKAKESRRANVKVLADRAKKSLSRIAPNVKIKIYNTTAEFEAATGDKNTAGKWSPNKGKGGTISINLDYATGRTVAHETVHAVLGTMIKSDKALERLTDKFLGVLAKNVDGDVKVELDNFINLYADKPEVMSEEFAAELGGMLADNYTKLSNKAQGIVKQWLDTIAKKIGLKEFTDSEIIDLLNTIAGKTAKGEVITEADVAILSDGAVITGEIPSGIERKGKESKFIDNLELERLPTHKNIIVKKRFNLRDIAGQVASSTLSDKLVAGRLGKFLLYGGVGYPEATGLLWAASNKTSADKITNKIKKSKDGFNYLMPAIMSNVSHMSNKDMTVVAIETLKEASKNGEIDLASLTASIEKAFGNKSLLKLQEGALNAIEGKTNINETLDALLDYIFTPKFTFVKRRNLLQSIIGDAKSQKPKYSTVGTFTKLAGSLAEPLVKDSEIYEVNVVYRTKGTLRTVKIAKTDPRYHKSYPFAVESSEKIEVLHLVEGYNLVDIFPEFTKADGDKKSLKQELEDKLGEYTEKYIRTNHGRTHGLSSYSAPIVADKPIRREMSQRTDKASEKLVSLFDRDNVPLTIPEAKEMVNEVLDWADWYDGLSGYVNKVFGEYGSDVLSILPLASMGNGSAGTVTMAINNVEKIYKGERPSGLAEYYNFVTDFLEGKGIKSDKMYNFFKALLGDPNAVAVDMHVYSIIKWKDSNKKQVNPANKKEFAKAKEFVNTLAKELGMQPREVQASLWALNILRTGGKPDSYEQYIEKHIKEKNLYQRVESWREQGYKPFSEVREAKEREQIGERKEKSQKVGIGYFKSKPAANVRSGNKAFRDAVEAKREAKRLEREANIKRIEKLQKEIEGSPAKSVEEVVEFSRDKGYEDTVIKDALLKRGFSKEQIETALATIIPTAIVKGAAKAVRDNKKSNLKADVDAVGIEHVKSTKWYRGLTVKQKDALNKKGISNILADKELALRKGSQPTKAGKKFRDTVKDVTGQTDTSAEVTMTKAKLLKEQIKTLVRGAKMGAKGLQDLKASFIKEISIELKSLTKSKIMTLTEARKVLAAVNQLNFKNYDKVSELVDKVIAEIENKGVRRAIKQVKTRLRKGAKSPKNPVNMRELAKEAVKVNEVYLTPAERVKYSDLLTEIQASFKLATSKTYRMANEADMLKALEVLNQKAEATRLKELATKLGLDGTGLTNSQLVELVNSVDVDEYLGTLKKEKAREARIALEKQAEYARIALNDVDGDTLTEQEKKDVRTLKEANLELLTSTDIRDLIKIVDNIVTNQTFASSGNLVSKIRSYKASEKATEVYNKGNTKMIDKSVITDLKSLALVFKSVFQSTRAAALFDKISGLTNLGIAYTKHKKAMNALAKSYDELFAKLLKNHKGLNKPESTMFRGLVAQLIQGTTSEDFDINTSRVKDHINKIKNGAQKQSTRLGLEVLEEQYEALKGLKSQEEVIEYAKGLKDGNWELVEFWMNHFESNKEPLKYNTEVVHGKSFEEVVGNYLPIKLKADGTATEDVDNQAFFDRNGLPATNPSVTTISRTKTKKLPPNRVLDLDFDSVMFNKAAGVSIDIETSAAYKDVYNFFHSPNMAKMFGTETIGVFQKKLTEMRKVQLGIASMDVNKDETIKAVNKVERIWKTIATTIGLGSVTQYPKQYISVAFNAMAHLGTDSGLMFKAMFTDKSKIPLLDMVSVSLRGETQAGTITGGTRISEAEKKATKAVVGRVVQETGLAAEKVREVLFYSLRKGDVNVAKSSWIAFYQKYLKDNNITDVDMATEHERMDEGIRQEAIAYAELKVEETQISSDESRGSEFYQSKETSRAILRGIFLPYQSFNINSKMRMLTDIRIIADKKADAVDRRDAGASLLGTAAEMITFQTMKYYVLAPIIGLGKVALMSLFGLDEPEEEEWDAEHKSKEFKFKQWYSALSKDLNPLAIGSFAEDMVIETLNLMQYFAEAKDGEAYVDYIKRLRDEGGGQMFYRYKDKEERGKGFGASLLGGGGLYSIPYSQFSETLDAYELMMDNTRRDDWGNLFEYNFTENQQLMLKFAFAAEFISLFGLGEADSRRLLRKMRKDAQKNTEKKKIN